MEDRDGEKGPTCEHGENKDYGVWHQAGRAEEIWKVPLCQSGVGSSNAIFCGGCKHWVHKKCSGIKGPLRPDPEFRCARCLGTARAIDEREVSEVEVGNEKLEVVPEFCYLGDMLSAGGGCDHTLQMCMGQVPPIASPSHQPPSAPSD